MKRRGVSDNSPVKQFVGGVYKAIAISSELMARLTGVRNESWSVVVFGKGAVTEVVV